MDSYRILPFFLFFVCAVTAQDVDFIEITQGSGYAQEVYYNLATQEATPVEINSWEIAFSGGFSAGIWLNEGTGGIHGELSLYSMHGEHNFSDTLTSDMADTRLYNGKEGYDHGAFATVSDPSNPFDFGWGTYSPVSHVVSGGPTYLLQQRDSSWLKFKIEKLEAGVFIFSYAGLDGSNASTDTVDTRAYPDRQLIHYSITNQQVIESIPTDWDLVFSRYYTKIPTGPVEFVDYLVTGVIQAPGVEVAQVTTMEPDTRPFDPSTDSLSTDVDVIGYDWKSFDLSTFSYSIVDDLVFFVKSKTDELYKLQFIDFEGSSSGISVFTQQSAGLVSDTRENQWLEGIAIQTYPNPFVSRVQLSIEDQGNSADIATWQVLDNTGRLIQSGPFGQSTLQGTFTHTLELGALPSGTYYYQVIGRNGATLTKPLLKK
ncbi:MAG: T9SS type A sorting domain-containing protein [Saprospiraceae bacterium]|nr:T9SS type A sorting domain-containing protein [Saprospiraceae bacterium]